MIERIALRTTFTVEKVLDLTNNPNQIVQQSIAMIQITDIQLDTITQGCFAQLGAVLETLFAIYRCDFS